MSYFGIGLDGLKYSENTAAIMRLASQHQAAFVWLMGCSYKPESPIDTARTWKRIPVFQEAELPGGFNVVICDCSPADWPGKVKQLGLGFVHPPRAIYVFGNESSGVSDRTLEIARSSGGQYCTIPEPCGVSYNVAQAAAVVLHDRYVARAKKSQKKFG